MFTLSVSADATVDPSVEASEWIWDPSVWLCEQALRSQWVVTFSDLGAGEGAKDLLKSKVQVLNSGDYQLKIRCILENART